MNSNLVHKSLCDRLERLSQSVTIFESESFCANNFCEFLQFRHILLVVLPVKIVRTNYIVAKHIQGQNDNIRFQTYSEDYQHLLVCTHAILYV